jgi:outer membrane protein assembly factor BamB
MGDLLCLDAATGKSVWASQFRKDFKLDKPPVWGWASTPVIDGDRLFCLVGGDGTTVVAFDKHTGQEQWRALSTREIGYAPPLLIDAAGKRQLLIWHTEALAGLDPATGQTYWSLDYPFEGEAQRPEVSIAAPRVAGDRVVLTSFYHGAQMLELTKDKPGAKLLWNQDGKQRLNRGLHTVMCTPIVKDGHVYGVCGYGELRCLKADTGERVWETRQPTGGPEKTFTNAFLVEQGDRVWIYNDLGDLIVAKLSPKGYEEISRVHLLDTTLSTRGRDVTWCHPAFANRCCYVRSDKEMVCVSLAAG